MDPDSPNYMKSTHMLRTEVAATQSIRIKRGSDISDYIDTLFKAVRAITLVYPAAEIAETMDSQIKHRFETLMAVIHEHWGNTGETNVKHLVGSSFYRQMVERELVEEHLDGHRAYKATAKAINTVDRFQYFLQWLTDRLRSIHPLPAKAPRW